MRPDATVVYHARIRLSEQSLRSLRGLLLGELVAKVLLALPEIRLATVGVDERVRIAVPDRSGLVRLQEALS